MVPPAHDSRYRPSCNHHSQPRLRAKPRQVFALPTAEATGRSGLKPRRYTATAEGSITFFPDPENDPDGEAYTWDCGFYPNGMTWAQPLALVGATLLGAGALLVVTAAAARLSAESRSVRGATSRAA